MKKSMQFLVGGLALICTSLPAFAENVVFKTEVFKEVEQQVNGEIKKTLIPAIEVLPAEEVVYILSFQNTGKTNVENMVVKNPIPDNTWYRADSARGEGTRISVSVDGGKHYGQLDNLRVVLADGSNRAANNKDVTHVRWDVEYLLQPGKTGTASYRAVVK